MGHEIRPEALGGLGFMDALIHWHTVSFSVNPKGDWREAMDTIGMKASEVTDGRFFVTMDREDDMTDDIAFFNVRCEDQDDAEGVVLIFNDAVLKPPPERQPIPEMPEWLKNLAKGD